jgi:hypothetical protein
LLVPWKGKEGKERKERKEGKEGKDSMIARGNTRSGKPDSSPFNFFRKP